MTDNLDSFRARIRNWARVYRDPMPVRTSPYCREPEVRENNVEAFSEPDYSDAEFIDLSLSMRRPAVLNWYLHRVSIVD